MKKFLSIALISLALPSTSLANTPSCPNPTSNTYELEISALYPNPNEGENEWVRIKNIGSHTTDLSQITLEDLTESPWTLSGELAALDEIEVSGFPFQLNNGADEVRLRTLDGTLIDYFSYESSSKGKVILRNDETEQGKPSSNEEEPSEESESPVQTPSIFPDFSEALPNPEGPDSEEEWIELYNSSNETLSLEGLWIDDSEGGSSPHGLSGSLSPGDFLLIDIEDSRINLNNSNDSIRLLGVDGEVLWEFEYTGASEGKSFALIHGESIWTTPSPGTENIAASSEEESENNYENGDLSEDIDITEVFPNPEGPDAEEEWIEITNRSTSDIRLGNWVIDDGPDGSAPYTLPDDLIIEAGASIIILRSDSGLALNNNGEVVQLMDFNGDIIDEIEYENSEEGQSYSEIQVEDSEELQASLNVQKKPTQNVWRWTEPSPAKPNPVAQEYTGEVLAYENQNLTLKTTTRTQNLFIESVSDTAAFILKKGNRILLQAIPSASGLEINHLELLSNNASSNSGPKIPWGLIGGSLLTAALIVWDIKKKKSTLKKH